LGILRSFPVVGIKLGGRAERQGRNAEDGEVALRSLWRGKNNCKGVFYQFSVVSFQLSVKADRGWENGGMGLGIYVSVPFCKAKCSFCNFSSGVFAAERMDAYVARVVEEVRGSRAWARKLGCAVPEEVDSVYFGGGTPSLLPPELVRRVFAGLRGEFEIVGGAEITVECAPGQLADETLEAFQREGMNRVSFGVQSFVDAECAAVGRLHTGASCLAELQRVGRAGVSRVGVDLICGLPGQTDESWRYSVEQAVESGVEHVSVYMLEVDEDSRLGREKMAGGSRYGAGILPDGDAVADWYGAGVSWLADGGVEQYEISNFARGGGWARHNLKYWVREEYVGFGMDAHSMLRVGAGGVRWANADSMSGYADRISFERTVDRVSERGGFEESLFLGLRLVRGVDLSGLDAGFVGEIAGAMEECVEGGLMAREGSWLRLTARGRMASNEVFERLLVVTV
jgi:oxygen-independent coproporphyrinogen-3 oxidase